MKSSRLSVFAGAGLCAAAMFVMDALPVQAQGGQGTWMRVGDTTTQRSETGTAVWAGKIYLIGGEAQGRQDSPMAQEFDPATLRWRDLAPMPKGASHVGVAAMDGKIYIAGGFTANVHKNPLDQFAEYDIAKNGWKQLPPLPSPLGSVGLAAVGGKLHVIGGRGPDGKTVGTHSVFDPASGKWAMAAPLPVARDHLGIAVVAGKIYIVGGRTNATVDNVGLTDVYDPATDKWQSLSAMPTPRSSGALVYYKDLIVYHGGECKDPQKRITFDEFEGFDPKTNMWRSLPKAPTGLHAQGGAAAGNSLYLLGGTAGCGGDNPSDAVYAFKLP
jgi:N-acetylneuraminic acid mutarotase